MQHISIGEMITLFWGALAATCPDKDLRSVMVASMVNEVLADQAAQRRAAQQLCQEGTGANCHSHFGEGMNTENTIEMA